MSRRDGGTESHGERVPAAAVHGAHGSTRSATDKEVPEPRVDREHEQHERHAERVPAAPSASPPRRAASAAGDADPGVGKPPALWEVRDRTALAPLLSPCPRPRARGPWPRGRTRRRLGLLPAAHRGHREHRHRLPPRLRCSVARPPVTNTPTHALGLGAAVVVVACAAKKWPGLPRLPCCSCRRRVGYIIADKPSAIGVRAWHSRHCPCLQRLLRLVGRRHLSCAMTIQPLARAESSTRKHVKRALTSIRTLPFTSMM